MSSDRSITVSTPLAPGTLLFEHMTGWEGLGKPFEYQVDLLSNSADIDVASVLGKPMTVALTIDGDHGPRYFHGIIARFGQVGWDGEQVRYRATLRPWFWLLTRTSNCRIFQGGKTVPDIVQEVFRDAGFSDFDASRLSQSYRPWDFLVQYRESDFNFVSRILEQEGIYYYFTHKADKHTLVLADAQSSHEKTPGYETIPFIPASLGTVREREHIDRWSFAGQVVPGKTFLDDFNFESPRGDRKSAVSSPRPGGYADFEIYNYPGEFKDQSEGEVQARVELERQQSDYEVFEGGGDARGLTTGALFDLSGYFRADQDKKYLVTSSSYVLDVAAYASQPDAGGSSDYRCSFSAIDAQQQFRPPAITPKPVVQGPQTAIVVGQKGEEIWTDKYGRVKLQFHWDRYGASDEESSCWVRVAQIWAGAKWGGIHLPRIGQEVIVDFLEGDPDRPIVTGRVYNADNMPPYPLPDNRTQSGIKSRSSPGGGPSNANELRFEDKKGSEQVFVQAEKDLQTLIKNDEQRTIGHDRQTDISNDEQITITGNRTEKVGKVETVTVAGNRSHSIGADDNLEVTGVRAQSIGKDDALTVGGKQVASIGKDQNLDVAGARQAAIGKDDTLDVDGKLQISVGKDGTLQIGGKLSINVKDEIVLHVGDSSFSLKKNGDITVSGKNITTSASSKATIKSDGDLVLKGSNIKQD
jgi:type VI secretion system secreted protein VgrG